MKRILRIAIPAAAAAVVILVVGLWPNKGPNGTSSSGRVYAILDIPELIRSAKVLHLHEWFYVPNISNGGPADTQRRKIGSDTWLDTINGRWRRWFTDLGLTDGAPPDEKQKKIKYHCLQWVCDGRYEMVLQCDLPIYKKDSSSRKDGEFTKLTPFMQTLQIRRMYPQVTAFAARFSKPGTLNRYVKVGEETIDGIVFGIWEGEQDWPSFDKATGETVYDGLQKIKDRVWLSPTSGAIRRLEFWFKGPSTNGIWVDNGGADVIERDVTPPPGTFDTTPPPDFEMKNTKETAPLASISDDCNILGFGDLELHCHIFFPLYDGTILFGWSSRDEKSTESQAPLFADLQPGGPLPKLPIEVQAFLPENPDCDLVYTGRHLTWTQKGDRFYEWSLFVPNKDLTSPKDYCAGMYEFRYEVNSTNPTAVERKPLKHPVAGFPFYNVKNSAEFNELALGAMADLSDNGVVPEGITYEYVMQLSKQIRDSLGQP